MTMWQTQVASLLAPRPPVEAEAAPKTLRIEAARRKNADHAAHAAAMKRKRILQLLRREQPTTLRVADWVGCCEQTARDTMLALQREGACHGRREGRLIVWVAA